ncbi:pseudouridine synthase [Vararia minispora EC-137]|uniref:Pseudouridine synthase n=1 Tax=Vararia minispora EC-137 TaxID=1314806 RepID=A0ACB8QKG9_9AGAM|nr:pseudouridine synthase [Vararia minispora EC-137]
MPKLASSSLPASALFGIVKPSGPTSMAIVDGIKQLARKSHLFMEAKQADVNRKSGKKQRRGKRGASDVKIGQGGTLDPLADGVLVIAIGKATKKLNDFLDCPKEYITTCLLGCETDSYDSEGARVRIAPWRHVTREMVEETLVRFRGNIEQTPPIFSALKMDGKPLYEYARNGIPLPRPIDKRPVTVHELELMEWKGSDHSYRWPEKALSQDEKKALEKTLSSLEGDVSVKDEVDPPVDSGAPDVPAAFVLKMRVSGGTYVRSLVHDLAHALGSAGHVVTLTRSRQKNYVLQLKEDGDCPCVSWEVFEAATKDEGERDEDGWCQWEREVMDKMVLVEGSGIGSS